MNSESTPGLDALLQNARRRSGLTQEQLAGLSTVSVRAIRDLEQGRVRNPRKETLKLLANAMRMSDNRRFELELAADAHAAGRVLQSLYSAELAAPPTPLRPLIGRRAELEALTGRLDNRHDRLLTLVGLPGVGKSRLAQEAALVLHARDRTPVLWVPMDRPADSGPEHGPQAPLNEWVRELVRGGDRYEELTSVIGAKPTLIVLDGLADSAAAVPSLLHLLRFCERLKIIVTTRRVSRPPAGRLLPLAPLPVPLPSADGSALPGDSLVAGRPAVELMLSYVSHMRPDLLPTDAVTATVAHICRRMDGIPQALEAAASWLLLHSPDQLLDIARSTPLLLVDGITPATGSSDGTLSERLHAVLAELDDRTAGFLGTLAGLPEPWTVDAAARASGTTLAETARDVHDLLLRGLIRQLPTEPGGPVGFTVLNLVRELLRAGRPATADLVGTAD
ncbi:helix-turn-helix domain-containing protein [Streptomyces sp. NBC_00285]|uniref:helix-turn-helix domain-containing protein n=1 Tax=Streptomyces sp. NBC_00285 TaxID=2975700 RepID=UPI002E2AB947|nr:helix-turn-helix domain-containing protein [Streptomyces sp. NBC_00285]